MNDLNGILSDQPKGILSYQPEGILSYQPEGISRRRHDENIHPFASRQQKHFSNKNTFACDGRINLPQQKYFSKKNTFSHSGQRKPALNITRRGNANARKEHLNITFRGERNTRKAPLKTPRSGNANTRKEPLNITLRGERNTRNAPPKMTLRGEGNPSKPRKPSENDKLLNITPRRKPFTNNQLHQRRNPIANIQQKVEMLAITPKKPYKSNRQKVLPESDNYKKKVWIGNISLRGTKGDFFAFIRSLHGSIFTHTFMSASPASGRIGKNLRYAILTCRSEEIASKIIQNAKGIGALQYMYKGIQLIVDDMWPTKKNVQQRKQREKQEGKRQWTRKGDSQRETTRTKTRIGRGTRGRARAAATIPTEGTPVATAVSTPTPPTTASTPLSTSPTPTPILTPTPARKINTEKIPTLPIPAGLSTSPTPSILLKPPMPTPLIEEEKNQIIPFNTKQFLKSMDLEKYFPFFLMHEVEEKSLILMKESHIKEIGIPYVPRVRIMEEIDKLKKKAQQKKMAWPRAPVSEQREIWSIPPSINAFLNSLSLDKYLNLFKENEIEMSSLLLLQDSDSQIQRLGLPVGPRVRITHELNKYKGK